MSRPATAAGADILEAADLRFGQVGIANVRVRSDDPGAVRDALQVRMDEAPSLFDRAPVVVDFSYLPTQPATAGATALLDAVRAAGMLPVGLAYGDTATGELARALGLPLLARFRDGHERAARQASAVAPGSPATDAAASAPPPAPPHPTSALQHLQSVRTGQQVYAQGADLIVVGAVANGAEVLADGNIHVYGILRGRAFAGALGDAAARIFCSAFRAEIVSIAGHYRVFEELPGEFADRAVQIRLEDGKLQIAAL